MVTISGYETIPRKPGIGRIYNPENNKSFIVFSSSDLKERIRNTVCFLERGELHSSIQCEWDPNIFECEILEITTDRKQYDYWSAKYDSFNSGYNVNVLKRDVPRTSGIYGILNTINNRIYIGWASSNMRQRVTQHVSNLERGIEPNRSFQKDWNTDRDRFVFVPLEETDDPSRELYWILKLKSITTGYNLKFGNNFYSYFDIIKMEEEFDANNTCPN